MTILCGPLQFQARASSRRRSALPALPAFRRTRRRPLPAQRLLRLVQRAKLVPTARAWDLPFACLVCHLCRLRQCIVAKSPDGWTRQIALKVAVSNPDFWNAHRELIEDQLKFLTTDIWQLEFTGLGLLPKPPQDPVFPDEDCVTLLSGGLDSFIGAVDLVADSKTPYTVSQVSAGDKHSQSYFASKIGGGLSHLQLNHNVKCPGDTERSQACTLNHLPGLRRSRCLQRCSTTKTITTSISISARTG